MSEWSVRVDLATTTPEDLADQLVEQLPQASAYTDLQTGVVSVRLVTEGGTVRAATTAALRATHEAIHPFQARIVGVEVITTEELDRRNTEPIIPPLVSSADAATIIGVSRQRVEQLADTDGFPRAVATIGSTGRRLWIRDHVEQFALLERRPGRAAVNT